MNGAPMGMVLEQDLEWIEQKILCNGYEKTTLTDSIDMIKDSWAVETCLSKAYKSLGSPTWRLLID